jgi:hypothetical protein
MRFSLKTAAFVAFVAVGLPSAARAAFWRCELPGGIYVVSLPTVASVSTHEYVVDGAARVTELTVATTTAVVARFYYQEPLVTKAPMGVGQSILDKAQGHVGDAANRAGIDEVWKKVVKSYPTTTHAHTVEYRLESVEQVKKLESSLEDAWRNNRETSIKVASSDGSGS